MAASWIDLHVCQHELGADQAILLRQDAPETSPLSDPRLYAIGAYDYLSLDLHSALSVRHSDPLDHTVPCNETFDGGLHHHLCSRLNSPLRQYPLEDSVLQDVADFIAFKTPGLSGVRDQNLGLAYPGRDPAVIRFEEGEQHTVVDPLSTAHWAAYLLALFQQQHCQAPFCGKASGYGASRPGSYYHEVILLSRMGKGVLALDQQISYGTSRDAQSTLGASAFIHDQVDSCHFQRTGWTEADAPATVRAQFPSQLYHLSAPLLAPGRTYEERDAQRHPSSNKAIRMV